jgi:hypothetical protein
MYPPKEQQTTLSVKDVKEYPVQMAAHNFLLLSAIKVWKIKQCTIYKEGP